MTSNTRPLIPVHFTQEELDAELEELLKEPVEDKPDSGRKIILSSIDAVAADNGSKKTQDQWFDYWAGIRDGRVMASMGDLYHYFKQLKQESERGNASQKAVVQTALASLRDDFDWENKQNWLISGTRMIYNASNESSRIIQHYRRPKKNLIKETQLDIPVYLGIPINDVAKETRGLKYLQVLHDTNDSMENLVQTLEFISDKKRKDIKVWTPPLTNERYSDTRSKYPERAAGFYYLRGGFLVSGNDLLNLAGHSRGVR